MEEALLTPLQLVLSLMPQNNISQCSPSPK